jgi:hypothetical protein
MSDATFLHRRAFLQSSAAAAAVGKAAWPAEATGSPSGLPHLAKPPVRSCILVFFYGGPSQLDTFDPKPDAPAEVRGEFRSVATAVPGVRLCEHLPRLAKLTGRLALVRGVHHPMRNHNSAAAEALTGRTPAGGDQELLTDDPLGMPTLGSAVSFALGRRAHTLPYVALPYTMQNVVQLPGQMPGLLGGAFDRFQVDRDPNAPDFSIPSLGRSGDLGRRQALLGSLDRAGLSGRAGRSGAYRDRAFRLLAAEEVRRPFELAKEPVRVRERYGRHCLGQCLLLARRLVEGGVNFVAVFDGHANGQDVNWDSHERIFTRHRELIPPADQGLSALLEDLQSRGLLESTLVVAMGEFGRTPKINRSAGRDHWPDCYTAVLAGSGVQGGAVHGASDRIGAYPAANPVTPGDLAATVFWRFGIDPAAEVHDQVGRPFKLAEGRPLAGLFG